MVILLSIFGPLVAGVVIFALVMFSSFMTKPASEQQVGCKGVGVEEGSISNKYMK